MNPVVAERKEEAEGHGQMSKVRGSEERDLHVQPWKYLEPGEGLRPTCKKTDPGKGPPPGM